MRSLTVLVLILALVSSRAEEPGVMTVNEAMRKRLFVDFVPPEYPEAARRKFWTGRGIFELTFDYETGRVRKIHVVKSTGHGMLDAHAIAALKLWKAKPRSIRTLRPFPIEFTYDRG